MKHVEHVSGTARQPRGCGPRMSTIQAVTMMPTRGVQAESGLLDPEIPALARARRRAAERRFADFGIAPAAPRPAAVIHIAGKDV